MSRPALSLWGSGPAASLSMSFSLLAEAILHMHLPDPLSYAQVMKKI